MKKVLLSSLMLFMVASIFAQNNTVVDRSAADAATQVLVGKFQLSDIQAVKMLKIQQRKLKNNLEVIQ